MPSGESVAKKLDYWDFLRAFTAMGKARGEGNG